MSFQSISTEIKGNIGILKFNRPEKANAMDSHFWQELPQAMQAFSENPQVRVVILYGEGKNFFSRHRPYNADEPETNDFGFGYRQSRRKNPAVYSKLARKYQCH
ncbi:MAG: hypothetical protein KatS3mg028_1139 [Bacteroidia bacterium]|nr:MAG: hypothetical protein KatS3mg028_1139 [Bacteroidia bacterium]